MERSKMSNMTDMETVRKILIDDLEGENFCEDGSENTDCFINPSNFSSNLTTEYEAWCAPHDPEPNLRTGNGRQNVHQVQKSTNVTITDQNYYDTIGSFNGLDK